VKFEDNTNSATHRMSRSSNNNNTVPELPTLADLLSGFEREDAADADEDNSEDELDEAALDEENQRVKEVMAANRDESTKNGYWMSQR